MLNHQQWNYMHGCVCTNNELETKCFKEASKSSRFRISFKFITMHKLTARIIQCIVPHKLIVLDLLNFCYHKLHDCTISQGCVEQSTCLPVLTALDAFRHLGQCACISLHQNLRFRYRYWYVILASACKLPLCWPHLALKSIPDSLRVYSKWPWINNHGLSGIFKQ